MTNQPLLDPNAIEALRAVSPDDGGAFFCELVDIFLQDTPKRIAEIELSLATKNATDLTRAAHSIKGSASNFGALALCDIARRMEQAGKDQTYPTVQTLLPALQTEFTRVKAALENLRLGK
ncbi:MAG: Hpt domain-containing protein [Opitutae bacterium]|nr:Hpt domain-containing protein [Opitutae bacterium]